VKYHTLVTPVRNNLATRIEFLLCGLKAFVGGRTITAVAVEEFQGHRANNMLKMMKCSAAQGALIAVSYELTANVILVNKRNESKAVAMAEARKHLTGKINEHEADAFRLGQIAGFDQAGKDHYDQT